MSGNSEMLLWLRILCSEWKMQRETTDQLIIVLFKSTILAANRLTTCYYLICHAVYSIMHAFSAFPKASRYFEYTIMECLNIMRSQSARGPKVLVCSPDVFYYLDLGCNGHVQNLLAILCVLVYIFLETGLMFFWICSSTLKVNMQGSFSCWK